MTLSAMPYTPRAYGHRCQGAGRGPYDGRPMTATFDLDDFLDACRTAMADDDGRRAVREVVRKAMEDPTAVGEALKPEMGGFTLLHHAADLTVLHVVWAPGMRIYPHNHQM